MVSSSSTEAEAGTDESAAQKRPLKDEEGLLTHYDAIVCGTGLTQSILASALARASKSVLHCDAADYYGELDAVWTLPFLTELYANQKKKDARPDGASEAPPQAPEESSEQIMLDPKGAAAAAHLVIHSICTHTDKFSGVTPGSRVVTPYGRAVAAAIPPPCDDKDDPPTDRNGEKVKSKQFTLTDWTLADGSHPILYVREESPQKTETEESTETLAPPLPNAKTTTIRTETAVRAADILEHRSRSLALDIQPMLVYCAGPAVTGLLQSGVADYLEFKSVEGLWYLPGTDSGKNGSSSSSSLQRVPCSKNDVFNTKLIQAMDKRRLMKFLQLAMDYGVLKAMEDEEEHLLKQQQREQAKAKNTATTGCTVVGDTASAVSSSSLSSNTKDSDDAAIGSSPPTSTVGKTSSSNVQSVNERFLNQGRSLARPQNKAVATQDMQILQDCIAAANYNNNNNNSRNSSGTNHSESTKVTVSGMDFETYLAEKQKLSPKLRALVRHAMALESVSGDSSALEASFSTTSSTTMPKAPSSSSISLVDGMTRLCQHMMALGKFGTTAFLVTLYGSGELPQAFCRSAAVYGATYLLRRAPKAVQLSAVVPTASATGVDDDDDHNTDPNQPRHPLKKVAGVQLHGATYNEDDVVPTKTISCTHVIVPRGVLMMNGATLVSSASSLSAEYEKTPSSRRKVLRVIRRISILAGKPLIQPDTPNDTHQRHVIVIPPGSVGNSGTIQALLMDETVNVAPHVTDGCTLVHLTMTVVQEREADQGIEGCFAVSKDPSSVSTRDQYDCVLERALQSILANTFGSAQEIMHVAFSYQLPDPNESLPANHIEGLHILPQTVPQLTVDAAFDQAAQLFAQICPGESFLAMSEQMNNTVKETLGDGHNEEDDVDLVLESAMGMIETPTVVAKEV